MEIEGIKGKAYITSAGEKAVHTGRIDSDGDHVLEVGGSTEFFNIDGFDSVDILDSGIIDEWPETTDAPEGHVNTAEIVYPGGNKLESFFELPGLISDDGPAPSKPVTQDEWGDWIDWTGGQRPVPEDVEVSVMRYGDTTETIAGAYLFQWGRAASCPILEYRTRKAPVMTTVTLYGNFERGGWCFGMLNDTRRDTQVITMVLKDGVPQSIANVEAIK